MEDKQILLNIDKVHTTTSYTIITAHKLKCK